MERMERLSDGGVWVCAARLVLLRLGVDLAIGGEVGIADFDITSRRKTRAFVDGEIVLVIDFLVIRFHYAWKCRNDLWRWLIRIIIVDSLNA